MALRTLSTCAAGEGAEIQWIVTSARRAKSHTIAQEAPDDSEARSCGLVGRDRRGRCRSIVSQLLSDKLSGDNPPSDPMRYSPKASSAPFVAGAETVVPANSFSIYSFS